MENLKIFEYNNMPISFITNEDGEPMVNATEMAKACGKNIKHWFENQYTVDYIKSYVELKGVKVIDGIPLSTFNTTSLSKIYPSLISVVRGKFSDNRKQGTFLCRGLSVEFARWLSPAFAIWCDERILEYLQLGFTATDDVLENLKSTPGYGADKAGELEVMREKYNELLAEREENAHKVNFFDTRTNLNDDYNKRGTIIISKVASKFGMRAEILNKFLVRKRVIIRVDGGYDIHPQYVGADIAYQVVKEETVYDDYDDIVHPGIKYMEYTHKGVELITQLLSEEGIEKK